MLVGLLWKTPFFKKNYILSLPFLFDYKSFIYLKTSWERPCQNLFGNISTLHQQHHRNLCSHWLFPRARWIYEVRFSPCRSHSIFFQLYHVCPGYLSSALYHKFPRSVFLSQNYRSVDLWNFPNFLFQNGDHICFFIPLVLLKCWVVHCS